MRRLEWLNSKAEQLLQQTEDAEDSAEQRLASEQRPAPERIR